MSRFSDRCKYIIRENGTNVYQISKEAPLDCTTLQRMVTGKRLPGKDFVRRFCDYLRMPETEVEELLALYRIEQIGEHAYYSRKYIKNVFHQLYELENDQANQPASRGIYQHLLNPLLSQQMSIRCENALLSVLAQCFRSESSAYIYTNLPATQSLIHYIELLNDRHPKDIEILHLISFCMNGVDNLSNLAALLTILPFTLSSALRYTPYFIYNHLGYAEFQNALYPFCLITREQVLLISGDFQDHLLLEDPAVIKSYADRFQAAIRQVHILIRKTGTPSEAFHFYKNAAALPDASIYGIEYQLCFTNLLRPQDLNDSLQISVPELSSLQPVIQAMFSQKKTFFYTKEGIDTFCRSGIFYGQAAALLPPLSRSSIRHLLQRYLESRRKDSCYMLKDDIRFPRHINVEIVDGSQLHIMKINGAHGFLILTIDEPSICEAFDDFFRSLAKDDDTCSLQESQDYIREKINELQESER